jgi:hypothetical protein
VREICDKIPKCKHTHTHVWKSAFEVFFFSTNYRSQKAAVWDAVAYERFIGKIGQWRVWKQIPLIAPALIGFKFFHMPENFN